MLPALNNMSGMFERKGVFGSLRKKLKIPKIKSKSVDESSLIEEPCLESLPLTPVSPTALLYEDFLFNIVCCYENVGDLNAANDHLRNLFSVSESEHKEVFERVQMKIDNFKYESILEHAMLITKVVRYELEDSKSPQHSWLGEMDAPASMILAAHLKSKHLDEVNAALAEWIAYTEIECEHKLNPKLYSELIDKIAEVNPKTGKFHPKSENEELSARFLKSSEVIITSCSEFVGNLPASEISPKKSGEILMEYFIIINKLRRFSLPESVAFGDLIRESIALGASKYLLKAKQKLNCHQENSETKMSELIKFVALANDTFETLSARYANIFESQVNIFYGELLFRAFDAKLAELVKPHVVEICEKQPMETFFKPDASSTVKKLFELFLCIKKFSDKGMEITTDFDFQTLHFVKWFSMNVDHTCDYPIFNALSRIQRALTIENFKSTDDTTKHSASAVDVLGILDSVVKFWEHSGLLSPMNEKAQDYICFVSSDICRFAGIYFDKAIEQSNGLKPLDEETVSYFKELCFITNNINFVIQKLQSLVVTLIKARDNNTIKLPEVVKNALRYGMKKKLEMFEECSSKMAPMIRTLLDKEVRVNVQSNRNSMFIDHLQMHMENCFQVLEVQLIAADFKVVQKTFRKTFIDIVGSTIQECQRAKVAPEFCTNLQRCFNSIEAIFQSSDNNVLNKEELMKIQEIRDFLHYFRFQTQDLIHQYYRDRCEMQKAAIVAPSGRALSVEASFDNETLVLNIWNAKNLYPKGSNHELHESYVKLNFLPKETFPAFENYKTKKFANSAFPMYEEFLKINLTTQQRNMKDAVIQFIVKDKNKLKVSNRLLGEAFLCFQDIEEGQSKSKLAKQISLPITHLSSEDMPSIKALQQRSDLGEKAAADFLSKLFSSKNKL